MFSQDILGEELFIIDEWALEEIEKKKKKTFQSNALNALFIRALLFIENIVKRSFINVFFLLSIFSLKVTLKVWKSFSRQLTTEWMNKWTKCLFKRRRLMSVENYWNYNPFNSILNFLNESSKTNKIDDWTIPRGK